MRFGEWVLDKIPESDQTTAVWYTTPERIFQVCRLNGLTETRSLRIAQEVAEGTSTPNDVITYLSTLRNNRKRRRK